MVVVVAVAVMGVAGVVITVAANMAVAVTEVTEAAHMVVVPMSITAFITGPAMEAIITGPAEGTAAALMSTMVFLAGPAMGAITTVLATVAAITIGPVEVMTVTAITITTGGIGQAMALAWRPAWQLAPSSTLCHRTACTQSMVAWRIAIATTSGISRNTRIPVSTMLS